MFGEIYWNEILKIVRGNLPRISYNTWFSDLEFKGIDPFNKVLFVKAGDSFVIKTINEKYSLYLEKVSSQILGEDYTINIT